MGNASLKIGVVGLGRMGLLHASILSFLPEVHISVICDGNGKVVRFAEKMFKGTQFVDNVNKLVDVKLDAVYITTPIPSHFPIAQFIYSNGIANNLFIEKTLATTYDEASSLSRLAQSSHGINMVGYMNRFAVTFQKGKELLEQGVIGQPISFEAHAISSDFVSVKKGTSPKGGALRDLGSHVLDIALWYFQNMQIDSVKENTRDTTYFKVKGFNNLEGVFDISWCRKGYRNPEMRLTIKGSEGIITVDNSSVKLQISNENPRVWYRQELKDNVAFLLGAPEYFREDEYFIRSILADHSVEPSFSTASKVDQLIDEVTHRTQQNV